MFALQIKTINTPQRIITTNAPLYMRQILRCHETTTRLRTKSGGKSQFMRHYGHKDTRRIPSAFVPLPPADDFDSPYAANKQRHPTTIVATWLCNELYWLQIYVNNIHGCPSSPKEISSWLKKVEEEEVGILFREERIERISASLKRALMAGGWLVS